jgi:hypothetical protein
MYVVIETNGETTVGFTNDVDVEVGDTTTVNVRDENGNFIQVTGVVVETIWEQL